MSVTDQLRQLGAPQRYYAFEASEDDPLWEPMLAVIDAAHDYREEFAKRGIQTAESMAAWDGLDVALAALVRAVEEHTR